MAHEYHEETGVVTETIACPFCKGRGVTDE